jgi:hypothetical protein
LIEEMVAVAAADALPAEERPSMSKDRMRGELDVQATSKIDQVSEAELVTPPLMLTGKAYFLWAALEALTAQGVILSYKNVQQWLALDTLGETTVSPRHYRRIKRLFCEHSGFAG